MATRMQQRRGTAAQWTSANPILGAGEIGFETDTGKFKIGNGSSAWSALVYYASAEDIASLVDGAPELLNTLGELANAMSDDPNFISSTYSMLNNHTDSTTTVHGIANTADLATMSHVSSQISTHSSDTTAVHGIANTALLATTANVTDAQTAAEATAAAALTAHNLDTTDVHGIPNTAVLVTTGDLTTHTDLSLNVHGIADTTALATMAYADGAVTDHNAETENVHGISDTTALVTTTILTTHTDLTENVHGIADVAQLATKQYADDAVTDHNTETLNVHGIANTANLVLTSDSRLSDTRTPTDNTVSTGKIVNSAVTSDKIAGDAITESKVADGAITSGKIANGTIVNADINASAEIDWTKLAVSSTVSSTELGYLDGVTSAIQTQLDAKYSSASATTDLALKADLASPALTGTPTAPTATLGTNTTQIATTAFVKAEVDAVIASAPGALNTLDELAAALGDDANFATTVTNSLAAKAPLASPTFTGTVTLPAAGIVFSDGTQAKEGVPSRTTINSVTDTYNLSTGGLALRDSLIECNKSTGFTVTIPANSTTAFPVGTSIDILQVGAGQVTIAGAAGVTVNATPGLKLRAQWSSATLFKRATDTWVVMGDLSA